MKVYACSHTQAGIERLAQQRQPLPAIAAPSKPERAPQPAPEPCTIIRLVIPRTEAQQIIHDIAHKHGLTFADLVGKGRYRRIVTARDEAIAAVKALTNGDRCSFSLPVIGRIFGGKDHTSVLASLRRHAKRTGT
jgi:hypothetical protein